MKKAYLIGLDAMIMPLAQRFIDEGVMPNLQRITAHGSINEILPSLPVWTPTNWATLATGSDTGTHGVTGWQVVLPNGEFINSFNSIALKAETIWEAAEKEGLKSACFHYPASMPARVKSGFIVDGCGTPGRLSPFQIAQSKGYATVDRLKDTERLQLNPASTWDNLPASALSPLAASFVLKTFRGQGEDQELYFLIIASTERGYDTVWLCSQPDGNTKLAVAKAQEWSNWVFHPFTFRNRQETGTFRFKVLELSPEAKSLRIYRSQVMPTRGFTEPEELATELVDKFGPYQEHASHFTYTDSIGDFDTALEEAEYQAQWIAQAGSYLMREKGASLFYWHWHWLDHITHIHLSGIDPVSPLFREDEYEIHLDRLRRSYMVADQAIGTILAGMGPEDYILVTSDHGNAPDVRMVDIQRFLYEKGFLYAKDDPVIVDRRIRADQIDWETTKAYQKPGMPGLELFINASPGTKRYEDIREDLLRELRTWVDPQTGRCPIAIALRKEDAAILGFWGESIGDVIIVFERGYAWGFTARGAVLGNPVDTIGLENTSAFGADRGAHHGPQLPTTHTGVSSNMAALFIMGPGIKKGYSRPVNKLGYIRMIDIVPTICYLLGIKPPAQSRGTIACDILEGNAADRHLLPELSREQAENVKGVAEIWDNKSYREMVARGQKEGK
ncbi:MAG: alkaline phosphatase family protein [Firmicutes bacterium]|nr:alkaline phosphatase family protein [Bacillota bacterium]